MNVNELLKLIPSKTFRDLAIETKVDTQVKKLSGEVMFKLILFINDADCIENNTVVFDRGLQSRNSFDKFTNTNKLFVSRANLNIRCKVVTSKKITKKPAENMLCYKYIGRRFLYHS